MSGAVRAGAGRLGVVIVMAALWLSGGAPVRADPPHPPLYKGERLIPVTVPAGSPLTLDGWTRDGRGLVYGLHVVAGQKVDIRFSSRSRFAYLVIFNLANPDEDAIYSSDEDGNVKSLTAPSNTTWLIRPYYSRMSPRRGLGAPYHIEIEVK